MKLLKSVDHEGILSSGSMELSEEKARNLTRFFCSNAYSFPD